jgi:hypothetical protein
MARQPHEPPFLPSDPAVARLYQTTDYEPQLILFIPTYYADALRSAQEHIDSIWRVTRDGGTSREEFERFHIVQSIWKRSSPLWWGVNDIVGWIDVRIWNAENEVRAALFLPTKRITRQMVRKQFVHKKRVAAPIDRALGNNAWHVRIEALVRQILAEPQVSRLHVPWEQWRAILMRIDVVGLIDDALARGRS